MNYKEYREQKQAEVDALPLAFAFSDEQFNEGMRKLGLNPEDTDKIVAVPGGGFCRKEDAKHVFETLSWGKLVDLMKDPEFAEDAFYYEMCNHEYGINWEADYDVVECFPGNSEYEEDKSGAEYLKERGYSEEICKAYSRARKRYFADAIKNDWF